jgi:hypothetical protein
MANKPEPIIDDEDLDLDATEVHVNGERLTDSHADELSGRERSQANLIPGRKSLTGERGKTSPVVNVRVPEQTRDGLRELAGGPSITKVARQALEDAQQYYVVWEQSFDNAHYEVVRFDKAMTLEEARRSFENFKTSARAMNWRVLQIRRGRDFVVENWLPARSNRRMAYRKPDGRLIDLSSLETCGYVLTQEDIDRMPAEELDRILREVEEVDG